LIYKTQVWQAILLTGTKTQAILCPKRWFIMEQNAGLSWVKTLEHLVWFKNNIAKDREFTGIVLYTGETTLPLGQGMYAVPMAALWS
jgi:hypothetical protein